MTDLMNCLDDTIYRLSCICIVFFSRLDYMHGAEVKTLACEVRFTRDLIFDFYLKFF